MRETTTAITETPPTSPREKKEINHRLYYYLEKKTNEINELPDKAKRQEKFHAIEDSLKKSGMPPFIGIRSYEHVEIGNNFYPEGIDDSHYAAHNQCNHLSPTFMYHFFAQCMRCNLLSEKNTIFLIAAFFFNTDIAIIKDSIEAANVTHNNFTLFRNCLDNYTLVSDIFPIDITFNQCGRPYMSRALGATATQLLKRPMIDREDAKEGRGIISVTLITNKENNQPVLTLHIPRGKEEYYKRLLIALTKADYTPHGKILDSAQEKRFGTYTHSITLTGFEEIKRFVIEACKYDLYDLEMLCKHNHIRIPASQNLSHSNSGP